MRVAALILGIVGGLYLLSIVVLATATVSGMGVAIAIVALAGAGLVLRFPGPGALFMVGAGLATLFLFSFNLATAIPIASLLAGGGLGLFIGLRETPKRMPGVDVVVERWASRTLGSVTVLTLFAMMVLTFADVWGRYLLNQPVFGGYEVTEFLMGVLIFSGLPILCAREGHVTIDVFDSLIPRRLRRGHLAVVNLISAIVLGILSWRMFVQAFELWRNKEVTMTLKIPHGPFALLFAVLAGAACLACVAVFWSYLRGTRDPIESEMSS